MIKNIIKLVSLLLVSVMLIACGSTPGSSKEDSPSLSEQLEKNDFSALAGVYVSGSGESITLNDQGLREDTDEEFFEDTFFDKVYGYARPIRVKDFPTAYLMFIFPEGMEIPNLKTDSSKVRIAYGHEIPLSEEDIYTKK